MAKRFDPKAKAKRQKIIAGVLGVVFLGVMAYQAPTVLGAFSGGSQAASEPAATPPPAVPVPATPGAPATPAPAATPEAQLVDSDLSPAPTQSQLVAFDRFESKDPFAQQADEEADGSGTGSPAEPLEPVVEEPSSEPRPEPPPPPSATTATARISVNGEVSEVRVGGSFPEDEEVFKLVSLTGNAAKVGIVDGAYATGDQTITLTKGGKPVTLMNTADGTTYVLRFLGTT